MNCTNTSQILTNSIYHRDNDQLRKLKLEAADAIVYATAQHHRAQLITFDA
jgi:predicted nucleic acid-binding protein